MACWCCCQGLLHSWAAPAQQLAGWSPACCKTAAMPAQLKLACLRDGLCSQPAGQAGRSSGDCGTAGRADHVLTLMPAWQVLLSALFGWLVFGEVRAAPCPLRVLSVPSRPSLLADLSACLSVQGPGSSVLQRCPWAALDLGLAMWPRCCRHPWPHPEATACAGALAGVHPGRGGCGRRHVPGLAGQRPRFPTHHRWGPTCTACPLLCAW